MLFSLNQTAISLKLKRPSGDLLVRVILFVVQQNVGEYFLLAAQQKCNSVLRLPIPKSMCVEIYKSFVLENSASFDFMYA